MGAVVTMRPNMVWPWGVVFQQQDEFNGHQRGTWYFRKPVNGEIAGPFHHFEEAQHQLHLANADAARV